MDHSNIHAVTEVLANQMDTYFTFLQDNRTNSTKTPQFMRVGNVTCKIGGRVK